jgi:hypothetical protein
LLVLCQACPSLHSRCWAVTDQDPWMASTGEWQRVTQSGGGGGGEVGHLGGRGAIEGA